MTTQNAALLTFTAAAAGTSDSPVQRNDSNTGVQVIIDITVATTTSVVCTIQGYDPASTKWYTLLASAALTATGTTVLTVYPGAAASANASISLPLPRTWRVEAVVTGASSALTATVGANLCA